MIKKSSVWITLFGILAIIFSIFVFLSLIPEIIEPYGLPTIFAFISAFCWLIFGIGVLKRLSWARTGIIIIAIVYIIDTFEQPRLLLEVISNHDFLKLSIIISGLLFFLAIVIIFTRRTIKEQFKSNVTQNEK